MLLKNYTKGDEYQKKILSQILEEGFLDENPRPHYEDPVNVNGNIVTDMDGNMINVKDNQHLIFKKNQ